ncbi:hypothetical protein [Allorhodopirellula heiligendammensis]|uniref:Uncharacterized protein n=1 Tax=Allorhodopirellula heiligendammensis TaxID=2714739 RepID=A0A5C6C615_9BACT|nr:hypothetical protein [Allorhodopirellula heiligendammensis]TWU19555.1 hypothetical protein Poly21_17290 [Allorhodopirellula heiligendammensis]
MASYTLSQSIRHDSEDYRTGDAIELDAKQAKTFRDRGWIDKPGAAKKSRRKPTRRNKKADEPATTTDNKPEPAEIEAEEVL